MDNILLLDTSIASDNKGDDIIMECVRKELAPIFENNFVRTLPTQVAPFHWYQTWRGLNVVNSFADSKFKFVGGSNILVPNLTTYYPQWNVNIFNYRPLKGCILVGVGAGKGAENGSDWHTRYVYKHMLSQYYYHSARDERSKQYMEYLGLKAINTGCVTMWMLTPEHCKQIPRKKTDRVIFTLTAGYADTNDQILVNTLLKNYQEVYFWPQGLGDYEYFQTLKNTSSIKVLQATKEAYDNYLLNYETDYVGTRLHGGIYAMRHKRRAIIIAIDERARGINESNNINCIEKSDIQSLDAMINSEFSTNIIMPFSEINRWKAQFDM